jgi:hypothetical protein
VQKWVEYKKQEMTNQGTAPETPKAAHGVYDQRVLDSPAQVRATGHAPPSQPACDAKA